MWITNDVALLTFVPFTVLVLRMTGLEQEMIPVIVLKNARSAAHGRKIHVNKYINQRGKTKKRAVASCQPAPNKVLLQEMSLTRWSVPKIPKQYEIWFAELGNHYGTSVQSGNRPVLVISNDMANRNSPIITVIPMSSKLKKLELNSLEQKI